MAKYSTNKKRRGWKSDTIPALLLLTSAEIEQLKIEPIHRSGRWEIAQVPDPVSASLVGGATPLILTLVVHQESYFIIHTLVAHADEKDRWLTALIGAIRKDFTLPEEIVVRDRALAEELRPLLEALDCKLLVAKLKAVPSVLRDIKRLMRQTPQSAT